MGINWSLLFSSTLETLVMVGLSTVFSLLLGLPLGVVLFITGPYSQGGLIEKPLLNKVLGKIINILRSFPFIILMILLIPFTRVIVGKSYGTMATVVPLSIAAAPFVARIIETSLKEVEPGVVQAARSMGSTNSQIVFKVLLPEAMPSLVSGITLTVINLIGYSAMAGTIGGGGLGSLAVSYGYYRFDTKVMLCAVVVLLIMVELIQFTGNKISSKMISRR